MKITGAKLKISGMLLLAALLLSAQACRKPRVTTVLFIGNSYTYVNDMPGMFSAIAKSLGEEIHAEMIAPGGYSWQQHAQDKSTQDKIREKKWDFVVLQEQSQRPDWPDYQLEKDVIPPALQLNEIIHDGNPAVKTVFYETWGHKNGDSGNCANLPETCTYDGMQRRLSATYARLSRQTAGTLAPVGTAWRKIRTEHPEIELYAGDGIHPSRQGSYLAACVFYRALFGKELTGADKPGLPADEAEILQKAAQEAVPASAALRE
jgi:hypothetical protein